MERGASVRARDRRVMTLRHRPGTAIRVTSEAALVATGVAQSGERRILGLELASNAKVRLRHTKPVDP
jgi:Transposase, Mutator family.